MADFKLPASASRFLFEEFDHIDFQNNDEGGGADYDEEADATEFFKPQADFDDTNRFFKESRFIADRIKKAPLASLRLSDCQARDDPDVN